MGNKQPNNAEHQEIKMVASDYQTPPYFQNLQVCVIGPPESGKSFLAMRWFCPDHVFSYCYTPTLEHEHYSARRRVVGSQTTVKMWDTPGRPRSLDLLPMYIRDTLIVAICIRSPHSDSCAEVRRWIEAARRKMATERVTGSILVIQNRSEQQSETTDSTREQSALENLCSENDCFFLAMDVYRDDIEIFNSKLDEMLSKLLLN